MRIALILLIAMMIGCGREPTLLEAGTYTVNGKYLVDEWPGGEPGKEFVSEMKLTVVEGEDQQSDVYRMKIVGSTTEAPGVVGDDGNIYFLIEHWKEKCGVWDQIFDAVYEPTSRTSFTGHSATFVSLCNISADGVCDCGEVFFSSDLDGKKK